MFCRKCGSQIPDDSQFCLRCGEKITAIEEMPIDSDTVTPPSCDKNDIPGIHPSSENITEDTKPNGNTLKYIAAAVGILLVLILLFSIIDTTRKCSLGNCDELKATGSRYCYQHTCPFSGCDYVKNERDKYCYLHTTKLCCAESNCNNQKLEGGEYCSTHTCKNAGCYELKYNSTEYCKAHQVDMRKRLTDSSFSFTLNSAGGIVFEFCATNSTGKEIKYVRFQVDLYNAVDDRVYDEIRNKSYVNVEIIGPVMHGKTVRLNNEIIGYCDDCAKISIKQITIIYTDGTSETGAFNYYYKD